MPPNNKPLIVKPTVEPTSSAGGAAFPWTDSAQQVQADPAMQQQVGMPTVPAPTEQVVGYTAPDAAPATQLPMTAEQLGGKSRLAMAGKLVAVLVTLGVLLGGGYFGILGFSDLRAKSSAKQFIAALNAGKTQEAYNLTSSNIRNKTSVSQFGQSLGDLTAKTPKYLKQTFNASGKQAVYVATEDGLPPASDGSHTGVFTVALVKHGAFSWQVDSVSVQ